MATNPFKAFIPYLVNGNSFASRLDEDYRSHDPSGGQWSTVGLTEPIKGEGFICDLQGAGKLMAVQFNERILPGKVRDEHLAKEVARIEQAEGRKVSKKDYAQLRDQCEFALLPKAFIRRTAVLVIFSQGYMLVCTSSQRRADDTVAKLISVFGESFAPWSITVKRDVQSVLTDLAKGENEGHNFYPGSTAVLKGAEKRTVRIKDKEISDDDVQALLKQAYGVTELGIDMMDEGEVKMSFVVNANLCFKRVENVGVKMGKGEDFFQFALLCAQAYRQMLPHWFEVCGGMADQPAAADEDDEL